jgi:hypothetical protein
MSILLAFMAQAATPVTPPLFELPREFWGEYNEVLADCGTGNNDSRLRVSWNTVQFYESRGEVEELLRQADGSLVVVAKHSGEGQTWQSVYQLRLSSDNQTLTVIHPQSAEIEQFGTDRRRCPVTQTKTK